MKFYSKSTSGFYESNLHTFIPDDAIEITEERWQELLLGQADGKIITTDTEGAPILIAPDPA